MTWSRKPPDDRTLFIDLVRMIVPEKCGMLTAEGRGPYLPDNWEEICRRTSDHMLAKYPDIGKRKHTDEEVEAQIKEMLTLRNQIAREIGFVSEREPEPLYVLTAFGMHKVPEDVRKLYEATVKLNKDGTPNRCVKANRWLWRYQKRASEIAAGAYVEGNDNPEMPAMTEEIWNGGR